jgi:hypothetical protein
MQTLLESWRDIPGYSGLYQVSDAGRVRVHPESPRTKGPSKPGKILSLKNSGGYLIATLMDSTGQRCGTTVNRLLAYAFHGAPPTSAHQAAHLDGNRANNFPSNICWATSKENHGHRVQHETDAKGARNGRSKIRECDVTNIRNAVMSGRTQISVASEFGVSNVQIRNIVHRKSWSHVQ